jgi:hypothetical protein
MYPNTFSREALAGNPSPDHMPVIVVVGGA